MSLRLSSLGGAFEPTGPPVQNNFARFLESFERLDFGLEVPYWTNHLKGTSRLKVARARIEGFVTKRGKLVIEPGRSF